MRLLLDTDILCKLGVAGLLPGAIGALGAATSECGCLPALPHMLRRGALVRRYGPDRCAALGEIASAFAVVDSPSDLWLAPLVGVPDIDVGEAQLLALAAERALLLLSGDKRSLRAAARLPGLPEALTDRIVTLEAILIELSRVRGVGAIREAVAPLLSLDQTVRICFSLSNPDPVGALGSYLRTLQDEVSPIRLWRPSEDT